MTTKKRPGNLESIPVPPDQGWAVQLVQELTYALDELHKRLVAGSL